MPRHRALPHRWREPFFEALRQVPVVSFACRAAGISRQTAYRHYRNDPAFRQRWDDAIEEAVDAIETQAVMLARQGSEKMVQFLLQTWRPQRYAPKLRHEVNQQVAFVSMREELEAGIERGMRLLPPAEEA